MPTNSLKGRKIWYRCRICRILVDKKYSISQHITEKHVHKKGTPTAERDDAEPAVLNPILKWRSNPTKETAPWEEVQLPEIVLLLTDCRQSCQYSRPSKTLINTATVASLTSGVSVVVAAKLVNTRKSNCKDIVVSPIRSSQLIRRKFNCLICRKKFTTRSSLNFHLKGHRGEKQYPCSKCNKSYQKPNDLKCHLVSRHANDPDVRADPSLSLKLQKKKMQVRRRRFRSKLYVRSFKHQCPQCPKKYDSPGRLAHHVQSHSNAKPYACETCGSKFKSELRLRQHRSRSNCQNVLDRMAARKYECQHCGSWLKSLRNFKYHLRTFHGVTEERREQSLICLFCGYTAVTAKVLNRHNRTHTGEKPYSCKACGNSFAFRPNLYAHIRSHCPAAKKMGLRPELKKPENKNTKSSSPRILQCSKCTKTFTRPNDRMVHEMSHGDTFPCSLCPAAFNKKRGLAIHKSKAHPEVTGESIKHICEICEQDFQTYSEHNKHMTDIHQLNCTGTQPHNLKCSKCPETFTESVIRDNHEMVCAASMQKATKNFKCSICVERFSTVQSTRYHEKCHGTAFMCPFCPGGFNNQGKLTSHKNREHPEAMKTFQSSSKRIKKATTDTSGPTSKDVLISEEMVTHPIDMDPLADLTSQPSAHSEIPKNNTIEIQKPFQCSMCVQRFSKLYYKIRHESMHGDKYFCPYCSAGFRTTRGIENHHLQLHPVKKKTCACNVCGEEFVTKYNLDSHRKTHDGEDKTHFELPEANPEKQTSSNSSGMEHSGLKLEVLDLLEDATPPAFKDPMSGLSRSEDQISDWVRTVSNNPLATVLADSESSFQSVIPTTVLKMELYEK